MTEKTTESQGRIDMPIKLTKLKNDDVTLAEFLDNQPKIVISTVGNIINMFHRIGPECVRILCFREKDIYGNASDEYSFETWEEALTYFFERETPSGVKHEIYGFQSTQEFIEFLAERKEYWL